jgi:hypothetical protein
MRFTNLTTRRGQRSLQILETRKESVIRRTQKFAHSPRADDDDDDDVDSDNPKTRKQTTRAQNHTMRMARTGAQIPPQNKQESAESDLP